MCLSNLLFITSVCDYVKPTSDAVEDVDGWPCVDRRLNNNATSTFSGCFVVDLLQTKYVHICMALYVYCISICIICLLGSTFFTEYTVLYVELKLKYVLWSYFI